MAASAISIRPDDGSTIQLMGSSIAVDFDEYPGAQPRRFKHRLWFHYGKERFGNRNACWLEIRFYIDDDHRQTWAKECSFATAADAIATYDPTQYLPVDATAEDKTALEYRFSRRAGRLLKEVKERGQFLRVLEPDNQSQLEAKIHRTEDLGP